MKHDTQYLRKAIDIIESLKRHDIDPILYGSLGASLYLGEFKKFGDVDLLVPSAWIGERWEHLLGIMYDQGFRLNDLHEHEFQSAKGELVAFAEEDMLVRDGIVDTLDQIIIKEIDNMEIRTLAPEQFLKAYRFSQNDGYRKVHRGKKDAEIIERLQDYIRRHTGKD